MNKKLFKVVATLLSLSTLLLPLSACGNSEFVELTQRTVSDLNYVGVREDLTIVSNVYEEVDLTTLGLKDNAYFLFGDRDNMYFGVQNSFSFGNDLWKNDVSQGKVSVMKYNFEDNTLTECSSMDTADRVAMINADTFIYFTYKRTGALGDFKYSYKITELSRQGNVKYTQTVEFDGKMDTFEQDMYRYVSGRRDYWWGNDPDQQFIVGVGRPVQGPSHPNTYDFIVDAALLGSFDYYDPFDLEESEDKVWNFIGGAIYYVEHPLYFATDNNYVALCSEYHEPRFLGNSYNVYFAYSFGEDVHYLFSENGNISKAIGLYII